MVSDDDEGEWPLQLPVGKCARLAYGPDFKHDDVLLLEMDEAILQEALVDGCVHPDSPTPAVYVRRRFDSSEVRRLSHVSCVDSGKPSVSNLHVRSQLHALFSSSPSSHTLYTNV